MFDVPLASYCPSGMSAIQIPRHFSKVFATQWRWRHLSDADGQKCADLPMYNLYLAEAGFRTNLHVDAHHTAFTASMCQGRKRWRVLTNADFAKAAAQHLVK